MKNTLLLAIILFVFFIVELYAGGKNEAEIDIQDTDGWTALIWAVYWNRIEIVELLISNRANVNIKTTKQHDILSEEWLPGTTALRMAGVLGREEIVQLLSNAGANE